ncbi:hypothetical protein MMM6_03950 [Helicobacter pylori]
MIKFLIIHALKTAKIPIVIKLVIASCIQNVYDFAIDLPQISINLIITRIFRDGIMPTNSTVIDANITHFGELLQSKMKVLRGMFFIVSIGVCIQ